MVYHGQGGGMTVTVSVAPAGDCSISNAVPTAYAAG